MDDRALVDAVLAGDARAQRRFVGRYLPIVRQTIGLTARAQMGPADVDDAVQHVFLTLFARDAHALRLWKGDASLKVYLKTVTRNLTVRQLRRSTRDNGRFRLILDAPARGEADGPSLIDVLAESAETAELDAETRLRLQEERTHLREAILGRLSERGQQMYQLIFVDELDVAGVAEQAGVTANNVYQWRNRIGELARAVLTEAGYPMLLLALLAPPLFTAPGKKMPEARKIHAADRLTECVGPIPGAPKTSEGR